MYHLQKVWRGSINGPPPPPLPEFRIKLSPIQASILFIQNGTSSGSSKVWICLFTCLVTQAIHLDLVPDLSTTTCRKRFMANWGLPWKTDNGKAAAKYISKTRLFKSSWEPVEIQHWTGALVGWRLLIHKMVGQANLSFENYSSQ